MEKLTIQNLQVVEFKSARKSQEVSDWEVGTPVFRAESCEYIALYGARSAFEALPKTQHRILVRDSVDAYSFLTQVAAGLYNNSVDTHDKSPVSYTHLTLPTTPYV